jgi:integrase
MVTNEKIEDALESFVRSKQKGTDSGNYQRNARSVIQEWITWLADREEPIENFDQLQVSHMRQYARQLKDRVDRDEIAGSTANTYWNYIAAFLGWCVYEELLTENPARKRRAEQELPDKRPRSDRQQFWNRADREALFDHLNERAHTAVDEQGLNAIKELRDRALASLLAYSGVRGAEILRDPNDERRTGIRWRDVDLEAGTLLVLGKSQADEEAPLPPQVRDPLNRLRQAFRPANNEWPVFPTLHRPTLSRVARTALADAGYNTSEIEKAIDEHDWMTLYRTYDLVPPALTTNGGRTVMQRICKEAEIDLDGDYDYLTPHGGRRGAGDVLYREDPVLAQTALRHRSIETTKDSYSYIEAGETATRAGNIFDADGDRDEK